MSPAKKLEQMRLKRLDSDADPIHTGSTITCEILAIHSPRVRFQGGFAIGIDRKQRICALENAADARRMKSRRGASAKKDSSDSSAVPMIDLRILIQFLNQCFIVIRFRDLRDDV